MERLVTHCGLVHRWVTTIMTTQAQERVDFRSLPRPPEGPPMVDWFRAGVAEVCDTLAGTDPALPVWNWSRMDQTAAFWFRRMAEETAVHRWDGQHAVGSDAPIDARLAVDGIDEMFEAVAPTARIDGALRAGATVHLHATDVEGEWLLTLAETSVTMTHGHGKGDAALRAPVSDLLLFLWNRLPPDTPGFEVFGDASLLTEWREKVRF
jgi:uncharacterized protein (TIGR03083 family)